MYFAWLGHYTTALSIPALVGFIFWVFIAERYKEQNFYYKMIHCSCAVMVNIKHWRMWAMFYSQFSMLFGLQRIYKHGNVIQLNWLSVGAH